jgi:hypothetical protein
MLLRMLVAFTLENLFEIVCLSQKQDNQDAAEDANWHLDARMGT